MKLLPHNVGPGPSGESIRFTSRLGFTRADLILLAGVLLLLVAIVIPATEKISEKSRLTQCIANLAQVNRAVLLYADENKHLFPSIPNCPAPGQWWYYKELVKSHAGLTGQSSSGDKVFACPSDRGYAGKGEPIRPFSRSEKHNYTSYVFNGVDLPGVPNISGREVNSIKDPNRTLLSMEWTAHAPLSWHQSKTGKENSPFYDGAESVCGFVDGHVAVTKIYYDGINAAFTRDPVAGYSYKYSGN